MDSNHRKEQRLVSGNRSSRRPESSFKGSRNADLSNNHLVANIRSGSGDHPKSTDLEGNEKRVLFQLGSIASYGISNNRLKTDPKVINGTKILMTSMSSSSSSSSTPSEDMIELNGKDEAKSRVSYENNQHNHPLFSVSSRSGELQGSLDNNTPGSRVSVGTHASVGPSPLSPTQSPPVQVMNRGGYDPQRIPSSVFSGTGALDWSETSNESLFSLNLGTSSLARDQAFHYNDLQKSGEILKSGELISYSPSLPVEVGDSVRKISDMEEKKSGETDVTTVGTDSEEKSSIPVVSWSSLGNSNNSDQTPTSMQSLSFPITKKNKKKKKKKKKKKTKKKKQRCCAWAWLSCFCCSNNCCTSCCKNTQPCCSCFRWPGCCCHCSSCSSSCCSWLFCCRWSSCCHWSCCSSSSVEVTDDEMRREYKGQKLQPIEQPKAKSSLYHKWLCCFPSCSWCCSCRSCSFC